MTLIEILNECRDIGKLLLGEHRWAEMLREPTEDEKERTIAKAALSIAELSES